MHFIKKYKDLKSKEYILTTEIIETSTAGEILNNKSKQQNEIISFNIKDSIKNSKSVSKYPSITLWDFIEMVSSDGISAIATSINHIMESDQISFVVNGCYAFKKDKAVAWLDNVETRYILYFKNQIKEGILGVESKINNKNVKTDIEIFRGKTKITPYYDNNKIKLKTKVTMEVAIGKVSKPNFSFDDKNLEIIKKSAEEMVENNMKKLYTEYKMKLIVTFWDLEELYTKSIQNCGKKSKKIGIKSLKNWMLKLLLR